MARASSCTFAKTRRRAGVAVKWITDLTVGETEEVSDAASMGGREGRRRQSERSTVRKWAIIYVYWVLFRIKILHQNNIKTWTWHAYDVREQWSFNANLNKQQKVASYCLESCQRTCHQRSLKLLHRMESNDCIILETLHQSLIQVNMRIAIRIGQKTNRQGDEIGRFAQKISTVSAWHLKRNTNRSGDKISCFPKAVLI